MFKGIMKRVILGASVIASGALGFMFSGGDGNDSGEKANTILNEPIFSIEKARADGAGGDCCCSNCDTTLPPPTSAWVYIKVDSY